MHEACCSWLITNQPGEIEDRGVHLWFAELSGPTNEMYGILSAEERERASRYQAPVDRDRFVLGRGLLRTLLGAYRHCPPQSLAFEYNSYGKPSLPSGPDTEALQFNLAHSEDALLVGITRGLRIGVDVERVDGEIDYERMAKRFFSAAEYAEWDRLPSLEKSDAWFRHWTRKEAYLKAVGVGLTQPLDTVEVSSVSPYPFLRIQGDAGEAARWQALPIVSCPDGLAAAVVVEDKIMPEIHLYHYRW